MWNNKIVVDYCESTGGLIVKRRCTHCDEVITLDIPSKWVDGFEKWIDGDELIQNALPEMPAGDREVLVSGICKQCWVTMFSEWEV